MKPKELLLVIGTVFVLLVGATAFYYGQSRLLKVQEFELLGYVSDKAGMGFNGTQILLGKVMPGAKGWRNLVLINNYSFDVVVNFQVFGNISKYVNIKPSVRISPGAKKRVPVTFTPDEDAEYGKYVGKLRAIFKRA